MRYTVVALIIAAMLTACHRSSTDQTAYMRGFSIPSPGIPALGPAPAPTYVALDYGKPDQPKLTEKEASKIRAVLGKVKPCQRPLVQYALLDGKPPDGRLAVFFRIVQTGREYRAPHVFGTRNEIYLLNGKLHATKDSESDDFAIAHEPCAPS
jgi:hypothetical protein